MTAINFPDNPTVGQEFSAGGRIWIWDGSVWGAKAVTTDNAIKIQDNYVLTLMSAI